MTKYRVYVRIFYVKVVYNHRENILTKASIWPLCTHFKPFKLALRTDIKSRLVSL